VADSKVAQADAQAKTRHSQLALGLGCQSAITVEALERVLSQLFAEHGLALTSVVALATVDRKRDEPGLLALARAHGWPITFYSAEELAFAARSQRSERVQTWIGAPAVAEPAALLLARTDELLLQRTIGRDQQTDAHLTVAVARMRRGEP
jgi:cobalamin biosynthesis protein CbiG